MPRAINEEIMRAIIRYVARAIMLLLVINCIAYIWIDQYRDELSNITTLSQEMLGYVEVAVIIFLFSWAFYVTWKYYTRK